LEQHSANLPFVVCRAVCQYQWDYIVFEFAAVWCGGEQPNGEHGESLETHGIGALLENATKQLPTATPAQIVQGCDGVQHCGQLLWDGVIFQGIPLSHEEQNGGQ
jgi:hypothetical protein